MKTTLLRFSAAVVVPEEWPARPTLNTEGGPKLVEDAAHPRFGKPHDEDPARVTHEGLGLPTAAQKAISEALVGLAAALAAIHPDIELSGIDVRA